MPKTQGQLSYGPLKTPYSVRVNSGSDVKYLAIQSDTGLSSSKNSEIDAMQIEPPFCVISVYSVYTDDSVFDLHNILLFSLSCTQFAF